METAPKLPRLTLKNEWLPLLFLVACWALAGWYWPQLPRRIPTHWGINGQPNGWMDKPWGVILGPTVATFVYVLLTAIPYLDPRRRNWPITLQMYPVLKNAMAALLLLITYLALSAAARPTQQLHENLLILATGLFFMVLGNYLPKVRSNFFIGVRTPWTLSSDVVWERTHRIVGRLFVLGGALMAGSAALPGLVSFAMIIAVTSGIALFALFYSWWLYQRLAELEPPTRPD